MADLETLKLAFHFHVMGALVRADGVVTDGEKALLDEAVPAMIAKGLMTEDHELTPAFSEAKTEALGSLRDLLDHESKLAYLAAFARAAGIDDNMDDTERSTISAAAAVLDVPSEEVWALFK